MRVFEKRGKRTPVFLRFSTVAGSRGAADTARDPARVRREVLIPKDGNWDLGRQQHAGVLIRDGNQVPDFIHSQNAGIPSPTGRSRTTSGTSSRIRPRPRNQFTWLFGDRGIPASACATWTASGRTPFSGSTPEGRALLGEVPTSRRTRASVAFTSEEGARHQPGIDPAHHQKDLYDAIERGEFPSWTLKVQVMPEKDARHLPLRSLSTSPRYGPTGDHPLLPMGKVGPRPRARQLLRRGGAGGVRPGELRAGDRSLSGPHAAGAALRLRRCAPLPAGDQPHPAAGERGEGRAGRPAETYGRDGAMRFDANGGRAKELRRPNSASGPQQSGDAYDHGLALSGVTGPQQRARHAEDDDFVQAGALYRVMTEDGRRRPESRTSRAASPRSRGPTWSSGPSVNSDAPTPPTTASGGPVAALARRTAMSDAAERNALELRAVGVRPWRRSGDVVGPEADLDLGLPPTRANERGRFAADAGQLPRAPRRRPRCSLSRGASPDLANDAGQTPLARRQLQGRRRDGRGLTARFGASADAPDPAGRTPMMFAAMFDREEMSTAAARGAEVLRPGAATGDTPASLATSMGASRSHAGPDRQRLSSISRSARRRPG